MQVLMAYRYPATRKAQSKCSHLREEATAAAVPADPALLAEGSNRAGLGFEPRMPMPA